MGVRWGSNRLHQLCTVYPLSSSSSWFCSISFNFVTDPWILLQFLQLIYWSCDCALDPVILFLIYWFCSWFWEFSPDLLDLLLILFIYPWSFNFAFYPDLEFALNLVLLILIQTDLFFIDFALDPVILLLILQNRSCDFARSADTVSNPLTTDG